MPDLFAEITQELHKTHPGAVYVGVTKMDHRLSLFGIVLEFKVPNGSRVYGWRDHVSETVVVSDKLPPM